MSRADEKPHTRRFRGTLYCLIAKDEREWHGGCPECADALPHPEYPGYFDDMERQVGLFGEVVER